MPPGPCVGREPSWSGDGSDDHASRRPGGTRGFLGNARSAPGGPRQESRTLGTDRAYNSGPYYLELEAPGRRIARGDDRHAASAGGARSPPSAARGRRQRAHAAASGQLGLSNEPTLSQED